MLGYSKPDPMDDRVLQAGRGSFPYRKRSRTTLLVLHDSHTKPSVLRPVEHLRWQGRKRGLLDIGYHLILDRTGASHLVRPIDSVGSHAPGYNHLSIAICLIGGLSEYGRYEDNFTDMQRSVLAKYCAGFMAEFPEAQVCGHSEIQKFKGQNHNCPGMDMNLVRLDMAQPFKMEGLPVRTLTEMVTGKTNWRTHGHRPTEAPEDSFPRHPDAPSEDRPGLPDGEA